MNDLVRSTCLPFLLGFGYDAPVGGLEEGGIYCRVSVISVLLLLSSHGRGWNDIVDGHVV